MEQIKTKIIDPTLKGIRARGMYYRGVIFLGLMITAEGPKLIEYNCRFGDPETQVILPLLSGDWGLVFRSLAEGNLSELKWKDLFTACVVLAAPGYPEAPVKGVAIDGELSHHTEGSYFLHAGTRRNEAGQWQTAGGRVLCAVGVGPTKEEARRYAYEQASHVSWEGLQKRSDIGLRPQINI
jgi:phosphoribosylamine--glycine ligase